jgi:putative methyltransferase (TIGR04325 family)
MKIAGVSLFQFVRSVSLSWRFPYGCYRGQYRSFAEALAAAPKSKKLGYNHADLAQEYRDQFSRYIGYYDYPVLMWLKDLLREGSQVFDYGGNIGTHFYGYETRLTYPQQLTWVVCELPEIVKAGQALAQEQQRPELHFTTEFAKAEGVDIFMTSGTVQYIEQSIIEQLAGLTVKPQHLFFNRMPLCEGESFVSLQNGGLVSYPLQVRNRQAFVDSLCALGYELMDEWTIYSEPVAVPFHPEFTTLYFSGLYLRKV